MALGGHQVVDFLRLVENSNSSSNNATLAAAFSRVFSRLPSNFFNDQSTIHQQLASINSETFTSSKLSLNSVTSNPNMNISDIRVLEHQTLKVPYEILNKKFRLAQKNIDREASHLQNSLTELENKLMNKEELITTGKINELLIGVANKLSVLKRKSLESIADEIEATNVCKRRLDHLKEYYWITEGGSADKSLTSNNTNPTIINWKRKRMDRMLVDHCLRAGFYETSIELAQRSDIEGLTNIDIFLVCKDIEASLARHETSRCLAWCHENKSKLRKIKSTLEFSLRQQEFIELVRSEQRVEAVKYAQKYFSNLEDFVGTATPNELLRVMGLLACQANTQIGRYKELFDMNRWNLLIQQFRQENFKLYQLTNASIFSITLQAGLAALKTPHCYRKDGNRNNECPVCSEGLNKLAASLPCAHCSQSRLVCFISGEQMNEHNQPLMLPNGYVYGEKSLRKMADENDGKVTCPRTNSVFHFKDIEKVFVM